MKNIRFFYLKIFNFLMVKFSIYLNRHVFVMIKVLPRLKKMLSGNKYTSRSSLGSAIYQCLQQIPKEDYLSVFRD